MGYVVSYDIICDQFPPDTFLADCLISTENAIVSGVAEARRLAHVDGWRRPVIAGQKRDLCPACYARYRQTKSGSINMP